MKPSRALISIGLVLFYQICCAQPTELSVDKWVKLLSERQDSQNKKYFLLDSLLNTADSVSTFRFLDHLNENSPSNNYHFAARFNCLKARQLYVKNLPSGINKVKGEVKALFTEVLHKAYESEDDELIALVSIMYGGLIYHFGETELAVMYLMNGVELNEQLHGTDSPANYQALADLLYTIHEYRGSVQYSRKAIEEWEKFPTGFPESSLMNCMNTAALGYHRQYIYDSAFIYYNKGLHMAEKLHNEVWKGIIFGNMGQIFYQQQKYDTALSLLLMDYRTSKAAGYYDNAGNSLQWAARTKLAMGEKAEALAAIREAINLLKRWPVPNYFRNAYYAATDIFGSVGMYDSALHYHRLYTKLNDSLETVVTLSGIAISKARLNDEKSKYSIQNLQRNKRSQLLQRNFLIGLIIFLSVVSLLLINRQRLKSRLKMQVMKQEIDAAKAQMKMFTDNIIEKTNLIEKLEQQVNNKTASDEQQAVITELTHQTILTEDDWIKFKTLFEKIYPGFFNQLKQKASDVSLAEQRMAALIRLQLTTRQAASMLGISVDSVHKTRQRLRQRLHIDAETALEVFISLG